jgi:SAM-dependent methyltransferase
MASAAALPFADGSFHAVISNHSLEHFERLDLCVAEIGRILAPGAFVYVAIPDSSTFTDRLYRWLARGGGHVNQISDVHVIPRLIGMDLAATRLLCTSLSFLNRRNISGRPPRKLLLFANGRESVIRALVYGLRTVDRWFGWRTCVYGWAYYFGDLDGVETNTWSNVCVGCGSASPSAYLEIAGRVRRRSFLPWLFTCPVCETSNYFTDDADFRNLH